MAQRAAISAGPASSGPSGRGLSALSLSFEGSTAAEGVGAPRMAAASRDGQAGKGGADRQRA